MSTDIPGAASQGTGQSVRSDASRTPLRDFLRTETGSALVLGAAALAALVWANLAPGVYEDTWTTVLSVRAGSGGVGLELREWVNSGLMALFFFVIGLEARREFDMGELRDRRRVALPLVAGLTGMVVPVSIYLAFTAGHGVDQGWGAAMSTDTAFALGTLAILGRRLPQALRASLLTASVVDDFVALGVIAVVHSGSLSWAALLAAVALLLVALLLGRFGVRHVAVHTVLAVGVWGALLRSGVDPVVTGLAFGLITYAYPASRTDLERASGLFRLFREQPTPELERSLRQGLQAAISPNDRLQQLYHPFTSYLIVPVFALANAGVHVTWNGLAQSLTSPITLGILVAFLLGKPLGITLAELLTTWLSRGRLRPQVGWGAVLAGGSAAGVGFTVSLLIATLALDGDDLMQAKVGILASVPLSLALTWAITSLVHALPEPTRGRALLGTAEGIIDLAVPVDPDQDHVRGPRTASVTVVEYGDFECPYCGKAEPVVRQLLAGVGDVRYVWRHLPLNDVHPRAQLAAEASEAAAGQDAFWQMHDVLLAHQGELRPQELLRHAEQLGLDTERFERDLRSPAAAAQVAEDVESADLSGVAGTPTFFVNGRLHRGPYDLAGLTEAVRSARERAAVVSP
ncbi:Na+/H+ antiporter NhaA [Streptomyces sp. NPDC086077]|uniref:Na+/H+ antiporter NhaA n=1 Tax=Streptomyces sp. NPDC086077 TaxID=3154862 RepID=UPI003445D95C